MLFLVFFISNLFAQDLVFMRENEMGKNIFKMSGEKVEQISHDFKNNLYPDITPDGKSIAFVAGDDLSKMTLVLLQGDKKILFNIKNAKTILHPQFSHDGQSLFFSMQTEKAEIGYFKFEKALNQIPSSVQVNGSDYLVYNVTPEMISMEGDLYFPVPSADRNFVLFHRTLGGKKEVMMYNLLENKMEKLDDGMAPALSFEEQFIAYTKKVEENWDIYLYDRFAKTSIKLTSDAAQDFAPTFDPQGNLIFASNRSGRFQIYEMKKSDFGKSEIILNKISSEADDYAARSSGETIWKQSKLMDFPAPARSSFGTVYHEGKVYVAGGHKGQEHTYPPESFSAQLDILDLTTGTWRTAAPKIFPCHGFTMAAYGNYIYAFGGFAYSEMYKPKWHSLNVVERYDITKNEWQVIGTMPRKRSSNVAVTVGSHVFLIAGWDSTPRFENDIDGKFHSAIDVFDLTNESFHTSNLELPKPLRRALSAVEYKGDIYLIGGIGEGGSHFKLLSNITKFSPGFGKFSEMKPLPFETFAPAAGVINNELMVFGGMFKIDEMNYEYVSHIFAMDFNTKTWRHTGRALNESKGFSQVVKTPEGLAIIGGHSYQDNTDAPVRTVEMITK